MTSFILHIQPLLLPGSADFGRLHSNVSTSDCLPSKFNTNCIEINILKLVFDNKTPLFTQLSNYSIVSVLRKTKTWDFCSVIYFLG